MSALTDHLRIVLAGLAPGRSTLAPAGRSDVAPTITAMTMLGAQVATHGGGLTVHGTGNGCLLAATDALDLGAALTPGLLIVGLVATYDMATTIRLAGASADAAELAALAGGLRDHGAQIDIGDQDGAVIVQTHGPPTANPALHEAANRSDTVVAALALGALNAPGRTTIAGLTRDPAGLVAPFTAAAAGVSAASAPQGQHRLTIEGQALLAPFHGDAP
ncbi:MULTISPECIES: hypothetical protein [unclassified Roseitalea]|uniref:hypothetical protein n=1 Tax=unclassified Roseitalea TaxID=2639107 RepID=UPI00273D2BDB|nr:MULTISPECIES: hypothetical protein [unclassified Roseitalea]